MILRKLEYFRESEADKHIRDIRFMLAITGIDHEFVDSQVARLGLHEPWRIARDLPPL